MEETITQEAPTSGASNAADFQPPTKSPQTAPGSLQQQGGLQSKTNPQELLNEYQNTQIQVTSQPAPARAQVRNDVTGLIIIALVAIPLALLLYKISNKLPDNKKSKNNPESAEPPEPQEPLEALQPEEPTVAIEPEETQTSPSNAEQTKPKRKSKKPKRRNK